MGKNGVTEASSAFHGVSETVRAIEKTRLKVGKGGPGKGVWAKGTNDEGESVLSVE